MLSNATFSQDSDTDYDFSEYVCPRCNTRMIIPPYEDGPVMEQGMQYIVDDHSADCTTYR